MDPWRKVKTELESYLGSNEVHYEPPENVKMSYPAIVFSRADFDKRHANDRVYSRYTVYTVTVIYRESDNIAVEKLSMRPLCGFNKHYKANNLNHDVFTLYY